MNKKVSRPTVRIDSEFNKELKKLLIDKGMTFQELASKLIQDWYNQNK